MFHCFILPTWNKVFLLLLLLLLLLLQGPNLLSDATYNLVEDLN